jgi:hypothetical protein
MIFHRPESSRNPRFDLCSSDATGAKVDMNLCVKASAAPVVDDEVDDNHENDDLRHLICLAGLPFCRSTNTFVHPFGDAAEATSAIAAQPPPTIGAAHPAIASSDAAAAASAPHNNWHENDPTEEEEEEEEEDDAPLLDDDSSTGAGMTLTVEEVDDMHPAPAPSPAAAAGATPVDRRPPSTVRDENRPTVRRRPF